MIQTQDVIEVGGASGLVVVDSKLNVVAMDGISASLLGIDADSALGAPVATLLGDLRLEIELLAVLLFRAPFADYRIVKNGHVFAISGALAILGGDLGLFVSVAEAR